MPGFTEELLGETGPVRSFTDELLGEVSDPESDPLGSPAEAAQFAQNQPPEPEKERILEQPFAEQPWYDHLGDAAKDIADGPVAQSLGALLEGTGAGALSQTTDEGAAALIAPGVQQSAAVDRPDRNQGYQGIAPEPEKIPREYAPGGLFEPVPRTQNYRGMVPPPANLPDEYAAGSQFEDNRRTIAAEQAERAGESPVASTAGQVLGGVAQGAALPYKGVIGSTLSAAGQLGAGLMGSGSGDLGDRAEQAGEFAKEHPYITGASVGLPAAAGAVQKGAGAVAKIMRDKQFGNRVAAFTTPAQRTAIAANKGGQQAVINLGRDVEAQGLHKTPWYQFWAPNAETYYNNASKARIAAGEAMEGTESKIAELGNPQIETGSIADDLDASADEVSSMMDQPAAQRDAGFRRDQAAGIRKATKVPLEGPAELVAEGGDDLPDWMEMTDQRGPVAPNFKEVPPGSVPSDSAPFSEAIKNRRYYDQGVNYAGKGGFEGAPMQEQVRRQIANQLRGNIEKGLDKSGLDTGLIDAWKGAKKKYSTAAAVEDPALAKMQGDYGGTLGLRDMAAAHVAGLSGGGGVVAAKAVQGRMPSIAASGQSKIATGLEALESTASPNVTATAARMGANAQLKKDVQEAQKKDGNSWFDRVLEML